MGDEHTITSYKKDNIRLMRRYLRLTQKEFITQFLSDESGKPTMSVATLSNLEAKGGKRLNEVIIALSENLAVDPSAFSMKTEEFAENLDNLLPSSDDTELIRRSNMRRGSINQLLNRLTMYFAEQMFEKKLKKGDKIESDRVLASKLGVGRSAVREALKVLDVLGMIDIRPGQGSYISSNEANFFIIPLSWSLFLNGTQVDYIVDVRNVLEVRAAYLAAECSNSDSLSMLYEISHKMHKALVEEDLKSFLEEDIEFHSCIAACSENTVIYSLLQTISNLMKRVSKSGMVNADQMREIYKEHQAICGYILTHNADAAANAMREHLENSGLRYNYRA